MGERRKLGRDMREGFRWKWRRWMLAAALVVGGLAPIAARRGRGGADLEGSIAFGRLAWGCQPEVYIMNADGSGARNLSNDPSLDDEADLSPDGGKVVFFSTREEDTNIY